MQDEFIAIYRQWGAVWAITLFPRGLIK